MPFMQAMLEGKTIQHTDLDTGEWVDVEEIYCGEDVLNYRIKPESKYRPFKDAEECLTEMSKHQPFGWVKDGSSFYSIQKVVSYRKDFIKLEGLWCDAGVIFRNATFFDGTPFGIKVEE